MFTRYTDELQIVKIEFLLYFLGPEKVITSEKLFLLFRCRSGLERDKHASGAICHTVELSILIHFSFAALDLKVFAISKDHLSP